MNGKKFYQLFLHSVLIVLVVEVLILSNENRKLKPMKGGAPEQKLQIGSYFVLDRLNALNASRFPDTTRPHLIYIFTTVCPFCKDNVKNWDSIFSALSDENISIFAISLDPVKETGNYVTANKISYPTFVAINPKQFKDINGFSGVPQTVLRSENGNVEKIWSGRLKEASVFEVINIASKINNIHKPK